MTAKLSVSDLLKLEVSGRAFGRKIFLICLSCFLVFIMETGANVSGTVENTERFIDQKFIEVVVKERFEELSKSFLEFMKSRITEEIVHQKDRFAGSCNDINSKLNSRLESEVEFLRDEIKSKNKIIDILVSERNHTTHTSHTHNSTNQTQKIASHAEKDFQFPKCHTRPIKNQSTEQKKFDHENRFNVLLPFDDTFNTANDEQNDLIATSEDKVEVKELPNSITVRKKSKNKSDQKQNNKKRYVAVVGDSIVKEIKGHLLSTKHDTVVVKSFSGATTKQMYDYIKPTLEMKPDQLVIHVGTNNFRKLENNERYY